MTTSPAIADALTTDGVRIAWTSTGDGPVLVLLPPVPFSDFTAEWRIPAMRDVYARLASRLRVVQLDGRGTGHSQRDVVDLSFEAALWDIDAVLEAVAPSGACPFPRLLPFLPDRAGVGEAPSRPCRTDGAVRRGAAWP